MLKLPKENKKNPIKGLIYAGYVFYELFLDLHSKTVHIESSFKERGYSLT